jgi:hypothetical protein
MKNAVFWGVAPCRCGRLNRRFGGSYRLQLPAHAGSSLANFSTLKMEAIRSSETSVNTRSTRRHIPEDGILHSHRRENLKNFTYFLLYLHNWTTDMKEGFQAQNIVEDKRNHLVGWKKSS